MCVLRVSDPRPSVRRVGGGGESAEGPEDRGVLRMSAAVEGAVSVESDDSDEAGDAGRGWERV